MRPWIEKRSKGEITAGDNSDIEPSISEPEPLPQTLLAGHTIVVGYGQIGAIAEGLQAETSPFLVIEDLPKVSASLKDKAIEATRQCLRSEILEAAKPSAASEIWSSRYPTPLRLVG